MRRVRTEKVSCRPTLVLTTILCLFGSERIRSCFLSGRDDGYLISSSLEKFALKNVVFMKYVHRLTVQRRLPSNFYERGL